VTLWGKQAETANEYLVKGDPVLIEGRLRLETWENSEGNKRSKLKIVAQRMVMLGNRRNSSSGKGTVTEEKPKDGDIPF